MNAVRVLLFARLKDLVGMESISIQMEMESTVADVRRKLATEFPSIVEILPRCAIAINGEYADDDSLIPLNAELAVIPPVSGGS